MTGLEPYAYLWASLLAAAILSAVALLAPVQRRITFLSGAIHAPAGVFGYTLGGYFAPNRLGGYALGIEDVVFGFASGLAAWLLVSPWPIARRLSVDWKAAEILRRILLFALVTPFVFFGLLFAGANPMTALMTTLILCTGFLLIRRSDLWPLAVPAALTYPLLHGAATAFAFWAWPSLPARWNSEDVWGATALLGVPLGELAWAASFGLSWPVIVAFLLNADPSVSDSYR